MHPLLFEIPIFGSTGGGIRIYTYGVLVALAFLAGILWTAREARHARHAETSPVNPEKILDLSFYIVLAALVGSRILYILIEWQRYVAHPLDVFRIWEGGLVFYGGFLGALLISLFYVRRHKLKYLQLADFFVVGTALGHSIGRLGCFAAGCCYGREAPNSFFSVTFPSSRFSLALPGVPLFPSQLFESAASFLIFLVLVFLSRKKRFNGQIFLMYIVLYSISRSLLETFRGDSVRGFMIPHFVSTSQFISACLLVMAIVIYRHLRSKRALGLLLVAFLSLTSSSCAKVIVHSRDRPMEPVSQLFSTSVPEAYKAGKEALLNLGYKVDREDTKASTIKTRWASTKATSHYVDLFDRKDYGTVSAYYQIQLHVMERGPKAEVEVAAPVRSITGRMKSSHEEEERILHKIADLLRKQDFEITNVGVEE